MMRRWAFALAIGLGSLPAFAREAAPTPATPDQLAVEAAPDSGARIAFESVNVNLGDVVRGQEAVATFTYQNKGTGPLHILSAKPG
jgi:hypothetical protein